MSHHNSQATGCSRERRTVAHVAPGAAAGPAHVVVLIDAGVPILRLVTGLACAGLSLRHDHGRNALIVSAVSTAAPSES